MFDFQTEETIPIAELPKQLPSRPHISTVWRWIKRGCRGVRLETVLIGGKRFTSKEAVDRFVHATSQDSLLSEPIAAPGAKARQANAELDQAGL